MRPKIICLFIFFLPMMNGQAPNVSALSGGPPLPPELRDGNADYYTTASRETGSQVFGVAAIRRQQPHGRPAKSKKYPAPLFHAASKAVRPGALRRLRVVRRRVPRGI
jgi:hypothetical protein